MERSLAAIMSIRSPLCFFNHHTPNRHRAKWDGLNFVSKCKGCGKEIRRRDSGRWEKDWIADEQAG